MLTNLYTLDMSVLPVRSAPLRIRFAMQVVNSKTRKVLIYPDSEPEFEPRYVRFAAGLLLKLDDGTSVQGSAQIVVTGRRIVGLFFDGSLGSTELDLSAGSAYAFSVDLDDLQPLVVRTNWRNRPIEARIRSRTGQEPAFLLQVYALFVQVRDDGGIVYTSLDSFLRLLTPEGRQRLRKP